MRSESDVFGDHCDGDTAFENEFVDNILCMLDIIVPALTVGDYLHLHCPKCDACLEYSGGKFMSDGSFFQGSLNCLRDVCRRRVDFLLTRKEARDCLSRLKERREN